MDRIVRILMVKLGEGFGEGTMLLAKAFRDSGFEVIYTEVQKPEAIVCSAIQESVDHIGVTTLPGANLDDLGKIIKLLEQEESGQIRVTAGGFMQPSDMEKIKRMGVAEIFPRGTTQEQLISWAKEHIRPVD